MAVMTALLVLRKKWEAFCSEDARLTSAAHRRKVIE